MKRTFIELTPFARKWKDVGLNDTHLESLFEVIVERDGVVIEGSGGVQKLRFALPGKGKSGSLRIFYFDIDEKVYLLTLLKKNEASNLSKSEIQQLKELSKQLKEASNGSIRRPQRRIRRGHRA